jgi:hypothetical protein
MDVIRVIADRQYVDVPCRLRLRSQLQERFHARAAAVSLAGEQAELDPVPPAVATIQQQDIPENSLSGLAGGTSPAKPRSPTRPLKSTVLGCAAGDGQESYEVLAGAAWRQRPLVTRQ